MIAQRPRGRGGRNCRSLSAREQEFREGKLSRPVSGRCMIENRPCCGLWAIPRMQCVQAAGETIPMTCDEAFDALTAPEPVAVAALAVHILGCRRCRDLQEILAPLRDMAATESGRGPVAPAPGPVRKDLPPASVRIAQDAAARLSGTSRRRSPPPEGNPRGYWAYLGAFLAGVAASLALAAAMPSAATSSGEEPVCIWQARSMDGAAAHEVALACITCHPHGSR